MATRPKPGYIAKDAVRSLVFEGGGGKGFAFSGALTTLERIKVLEFDAASHRVMSSCEVKCFAGSSAGAITAMLVSCGYSPREIDQLFHDIDFTALCGKPTVGHVLTIDPDTGVTWVNDKGIVPPAPQPQKRGPRKNPCEDPDAVGLESRIPKALSSILKYAVLPWVSSGAAASLLAASSIAAPALLASLAYIGLNSTRAKVSGSQAKPGMADVMMQNIASTLSCLLVDKGVFCGEKYYRAFERLIRRAMDERGEITDFSFVSAEISREEQIKEDSLSMTFKTHYQEFGTKLGMMATDLSTHKSVFFSKDTTPDFPVALAVRASMGLPLIFKPIILAAETARTLTRDPRAGDARAIYVDGGLFNNVPLSAIDEKWGDGKKWTTLALRLGDEEPKDIDSLSGVLESWLIDTGVWGSGESQIHRSLGTDTRTILLKSSGLSSLDFAAPNQACADFLEDVNRMRIFEYFDCDPNDYKKANKG